MRGGLRLPALIVTLGLLAGCSDPAGAARREAAAARRKSASASPTAVATPAKRHARRRFTWRQAAGTVRTTHGLRVHTGAFTDGRIRVVLTDVAGHATRTVEAAVTPQTVAVGRYTLTGLRVARSRRAGVHGIAFHYRRG